MRPVQGLGTTNLKFAAAFPASGDNRLKPPNWDRIQEIYHSALAQPRSERDPFVSQACAGDPALLRQLKLLLEADDSPVGFLDSPITRLDPLPDNLIGTKVGERYVIERKLGDGGMSHVYLARQPKLNREPVVIKVLSPAFVQNPHMRKKFEHEVEALLRIRHARVVRVLDRDELPDGRPYIVMDYVDGETLRSQIPAEGMDLERVASILKQIGEALEHIHGKGIFHRDLKPENIMLKRGTDSVVLVDFGIAKVINPEMAPNTTHAPPIGTLLYMSPEQLRDQEVTATSDIYSMGVVAYELVGGRRPFKASSAPELLELQKAGVKGKLKQLREDLSPKAEKIISDALSFEPQTRYQNAKEFGDELAGTLLASRKMALPILKWMHKNRRTVTATLIALVMLLSLFVYWYINQPPDTPIRQLSANIRSAESPPNTLVHSFRYWLTIQETRDGQNYKEPFNSHGEETFERGDKFRLTVFSPEPAYVYVINEGPPEPKDTNFRLIYPNSATNNGSATIGANQSIESDWINFRGPAGDDNFWIVWSVSPVSQLETAKNEAFKHPRGGLTDGTVVAVKQFLKMKQSEVEVTVGHYKETQKAIARGRGDLLVTLAQFKHR